MRIPHTGKLMDFSKVTQLIQQESQDWNEISLFLIQSPCNSTPLLTSQCLISKPSFMKSEDTSLRLWLWQNVSAVSPDSPGNYKSPQVLNQFRFPHLLLKRRPLEKTFALNYLDPLYGITISSPFNPGYFLNYYPFQRWVNTLFHLARYFTQVFSFFSWPLSYYQFHFVFCFFFCPQI